MKKIKAEDIAGYRIPGNLKYSPDGKSLVFELQQGDLEKNDYKKDLWLAENDTVRRLTASEDSSFLAWLDDSHILMSRRSDEDKPGTTALYSIDIHGGEAVKVCDVPASIVSLKKIHDGLFAAVVVIDANEPDLYLKSKDERKAYFEERKKNKDYEVLDEVPWWQNGRHFTNKLRTALFLMDADHGYALKRITNPLFDLTSFDIDGNEIVYAGSEWKSLVNLYGKIFSYDIESGKTSVLYGKEDYSFGQIFTLDKRLYVQASDLKHYGVNETLNIYEVKDGQLVLKYVPEVSMYNSVLSDTIEVSGSFVKPDDSTMMTMATVEDHTVIDVYDEKFEPRRIWDRPGTLGGFDACRDSITFVYQDWNHVAELYVMDSDGKNVRQISHFNDEMLKDRYIAEPQPLLYGSGDEALKGWVLLPEDFDESRSYPAVLDIHGGPRCVYGETFFHEMQVWVSEGFVVFFTNIRGSDGRGDAFADIRGRYGEVDYQNLMDFTDAVLKKYPNIDKKRVCETGGSYGGFMTNWIITHTHRFAAAASQRSISNWVSMTFLADIGTYFDTDQCNAKSVFDYDALWKESPLKYAQGAVTPTLFIHSDEDHRCPLEQGMQMMQALAVQGVETRMCLFHGENHELSRSGKPQHRVRRLNEITDWFKAHTKEQ